MQGEIARTKTYKDLFDIQYKSMVTEYGSKSSKVRVDTLGLNQPDNPNLYITGT